MNHRMIGTTCEKEITVTEQMLAQNVGSGEVSVYATPMMIALIENAASACYAPFLEAGFTTVGTAMNVLHVAATPAGMKVRAVAEITAVEGKKIDFSVKAYDETGLIGEGTHTRFVVFKEKFEQKAAAKLSGK